MQARSSSGYFATKITSSFNSLCMLSSTAWMELPLTVSCWMESIGSSISSPSRSFLSWFPLKKSRYSNPQMANSRRARSPMIKLRLDFFLPSSGNCCLTAGRSTGTTGISSTDSCASWKCVGSPQISQTSRCASIISPQIGHSRFPVDADSSITLSCFGGDVSPNSSPQIGQTDRPSSIISSQNGHFFMMIVV